MVCIHCGAKTHTINSRSQKRSNSVWRRRQCLQCGAVFTSVESADYAAAWRVQSKTTVLEPFKRDKLFLSVYKACEHRKTALNDASGLTDTIMAKLLPFTQNGVIKRTQIIETAQVALNRFDRAASVFYAARHRA